MNGTGIPHRRMDSPAKGVLGTRLRESRLAARMTLGAVGDLIGIRRIQVGRFERGLSRPTKEQVEKLAQIFDWDEVPAPERLPRKSPPVGVTSGLRQAAQKAGYGDNEIKALERFADGISVHEEDEFSLRRLNRSAQYVMDNIPKLVELYEGTLREIHRLEQRMSGGVTIEQVEVLRDKARRWDDLQAIMERKSRV